MILYGVKRTYHGQKIIEDQSCEKCGSNAFLLTNEYAAAHIFFIPFLAVMYHPLAFCTGCKKRYSLKSFSKKYNLDLTKEDMDNIKDELYSQLSDEEKAKYKRRSAVGFTFACILFVLFFILIVASTSS